MALFPTSPSNGQTANVDGIQYTYSSSQTAWVRSGTFVGNAVANTVTASGNITANFFIGNGSQLTGVISSIANTVSDNAQPNITSVGTLTSLAVNGNITAANITANTGVFTGNGSGLTALNASNISSGTLAQARLANSNVILGNTTLALGTTTTTIAGLSSVTSTSFVGALTGAATTAGTVTTAAQPNITSVGTLTSLGVNGNITAANITANTGVFTGNGSGLSAIVGANVTGQVSFAATANSVAGANVSGTVSSATTAGTVTTAAQPNITSVGTLTSLGVNGNITAANITANTGVFTGNGSGLSAIAGANVTGTVSSATTAGTVTTAAQPNITSVGTLSALTVSGNASAGNLNTAGAVVASTLTSNVATGTAPLTVTSTTRVANLNVAHANVADFISVAAGTGNNFLVFANAATGNIAELTSTGLIANLSNNSITATTFVGSLSGAATSATTAGTVTTAAQPNITSVGTLTSLGVNGTVTAVAFTANTGIFTGNGSGLSAITGANVTGAVAFATTANAVAGANVSGTVSSATTAGTVTTAAQPNITSVGTLTSLGVSGTVTAPAFTANTGIFTGNGSGLTALAGANVTGTVANATFATSAGTAGTVTTAAQPNITSVGTLTSLGVNGTVTAVAFTANTGVFTGNGNGLSSIVGANVTGAVAFATTANAVAGANVSGAVAFATTANAVAGANVSGTVSSATTAGTVTTAAQPNITSVGTLTSATVTGNVAAGNLTTTGVLSVTGTGVSSIAGNLDMTGNTIINLATPTNATDAATKQYVDDVAQGLHTHDSCNAATNTTLATISGGTVTYNNGTSGVGATLTTTGSYTTIDGVTLSNGMRILVKDEANTAHNGIYDRTSSTVLTRSDDFNTPTEMAGGDFTFVTAGTLYDNTGWVMPDAVTTVGTSPVVWIQFSGAGTYTAGTGLTLTGSQFSVNASQTQITSVGTLTGLAVNGNITAANITANTGVFTGNGSALTALNASNISTGTLAQARLANSNVILGSTTLALGTTTTTIAGLSSVTSTTFVGALTGAATTAGTVTTAAQPNITSVGTLTSLGVSGTVTAPAFTANTGIFTGNGSGLSAIAGANVTGTVASATSAGSATTAGTVTTAAQPNITSVGTLTSLGVSGTVTASTLTSNVATGTAPLTVTSTTRVANLNVAQAGVADTISVAAGTGNNFLIFANAATGNVAELTSTGLTANLSNNSITATTFVGALSGAATSATTAGTVTTAAQPNITSTGTLTSLTVSGGTNLATSSGNVGIRTSSPQTRLQIFGSNAPETGDAASTEAILSLIRDGSATVWREGASFALGRWQTGGGSNPFSRLDINLKSVADNSSLPNVTVMTLQDNGNVGIGTVTPASRLDVRGDMRVVGTSGVASQILLGAISGISNGYEITQTSANEIWHGWRLGNNSYAMYLTTAGNLGIGTTSPQARLDVNSGASAATAVFNSTSNTYLQLQNSGTNGLYLQSATSAAYLFNQLNTPLLIGTNNTERMRITAAGNVCIGTGATDVSALSISRNSSTASVAASSSIVLSNRNTSINGTIAGGIFIDTFRDVADPHYSGGIWFTRNQTSGNLASGSDIVFGAQDNNSSSALPSERMRINAAGNVGIGTTPITRLDVDGVIRVGSASGASDPGTGGVMYIVGSGQFQTVIGGAAFAVHTGANNARTERMRIDASGNVGIGTSSPGVRLDVSGSIRASQSITIGTGGTYEAGSIYSDSNWGMIFRARQASPNQADFLWTTSADSQRMVLNTSGQLGIGTSSPNSRLQSAYSVPSSVPSAGAGGHGLAVGAAGFGLAAGALNNGDGYLQATRWDGTAANYNIILQPNGGFVGIGTSSPGTSLQVNGGIRARGGAPGSGGVNNNGYAFSGNSGDTDGGMFSSADGQIEFYTDSTEKMRIFGANVGIGTTSFVGRFNVSLGNATSNGAPGAWDNTFALFGGTTANAAALALGFTSLAGGIISALAPNVAWQPMNYQASSHLFYGFGSEVMRINTSGNVGIGTSSPAARLDVNGDIRVRSNIAYVSPNGSNTITSRMANGGTLSWNGNAGQLFSIVDSMTGNIFTVNDVSGIPLISVDSGGNIQFAVSGGFVNYGVTTGIAAAGSTQATATALTRPINVVSTVSASTGVILPTVPPGARVIVMNTSGTALNVYPPSGAIINSAATNAAYSMPAGSRLEFISVSATQWYTMNATYG